MAELRLGDDVDDFCVKCKRITNHVIVSLLKETPAKVRCRSCYSEHDYRHEKAPPTKKELKQKALCEQVLAKANPTTAATED